LPRWDELATDAIAIVVNNKSADTIFTFERLQNQLSGLMGKKQQIIFDGLNATSTVRFAIDSVLRGKKFDTSVVMAVSGSKAVLDYVAANENAIGLVGISWIGNPEDTAQVEMLKKVKMVYVKCDQCTDSPYVKPNQLNIMTRRYPLVRGLYFILKENYSGLGSGFLNFLQYERGQLIFRRAYLGSSKMGFAIRNVKINEKLEKDQ
jgi:phosphate transport system substrate-binding protein